MPPLRSMIFVSHANPEDDAFAQWLALRLAAEGYPVWCDVTKLLGGEKFWDDIEEAIRDRTVKFLYVLSRVSNHKEGAIRELDLAFNVARKESFKDFVIPLALDDLPSREFNIRLGGINAIPFRNQWHAGLAQLLEKLEESGVARRADFNPQAVATWWRERSDFAKGVLEIPETLTTNVYELRPATIWFHRPTVALVNAAAEPMAIPYPHQWSGGRLVSFATAAELQHCLGTAVAIADSESRLIGERGRDDRPRLWSFADERAVVTKLLNSAWQSLLSERQLPTHTFASGSPAFYLPSGPDPVRYHYRSPDGSLRWRQLTGFKTMTRLDGAQWRRHWHFALEARPTDRPRWGFVMKYHVLFSSDGTRIWDSKEMLAKARRSQCKGWWNDTWRDMTAAAVSVLAQDANTIVMRVGPTSTLQLGASPLLLQSPVSYDESALGGQSEPAVNTDEPDEIEADDVEEEEGQEPAQ